MHVSTLPVEKDPSFASSKARGVIGALLVDIVGPKLLLWRERVYAQPVAPDTIRGSLSFAQRCLARDRKRRAYRQNRARHAPRNGSADRLLER